MARLGMDADAVEASARQLQQGAERAMQLASSIDATVRELPSVWEGQRAQEFSHERWPEHRRALLAAAEAVKGLGQSALNNAAEQREASGSAGSGGGIGRGTTFTGSPGTSGGPWMTAPVPPGFEDYAHGITRDIADFWNLKLAGTPVTIADITGKIPVLSGITDWIEFGDMITDSGFTGAQKGVFLGADAVAQFIKPIGPVGYLGSAAIELWSGVGQDVIKADFSAETRATAWDWMMKNPGDTVDVIGQSIFEAGRRAANALWPW